MRDIAFQACVGPAPQHPSLDEPPPGDWEDGPARSPAWQDINAPEVRTHVERDGSTSVELVVAGAYALAARIAREPGEKYFGFGVRSDVAERAEGVVENWVGEGPYQLAEYPLAGAITPRWALRQRREAAYYPVPWAMSSTGFGVLIGNFELSRFRFDDRWSVEVYADRLRLRLFEAPTIAGLLEMFTAATGRQPHPAAPWFLGPWIQTGHANLVPLEEEARILATLRNADAPVSAVETHMRRLPGGAHEGCREAERKRTALFHQHGLASLTYLNPFVSRDYSQRIDRALPLMLQTADGKPYMHDAYIGGREPPVAEEGQLDFTNAAAGELFAELAAEAIEDGHHGWMEDFGEYTPPDSIAHDGSTGTELHNRYPVLFHAAGAQATNGKPVARMVRSGWTGSAKHSPLVWGGDPTTGWGFDGLRSALTQGLSAGLSGIAFWGSDIGGFFTLGDQELDGELLIRWIQLGALSPLMRTKAEGIAMPPRRRPQVWDPEILPHWRRWAKLHTQLSPYLLAAAAEYSSTGTPLMRHMRLVDPDCGADDQYMLGPDLLVAPVLESGCRERKVVLPRGEWVDVWRSAAYDPETGGIVPGEPRILEGPAEAMLPAPLEEIPLLMRQGARIPLLPPQVWSLASEGLSELAQSAGHFLFLA